MKTALLSVWRENHTRARYPLAAGVVFVIALAVLGALQGNGTGLISGSLPIRTERSKAAYAQHG